MLFTSMNFQNPTKVSAKIWISVPRIHDFGIISFGAYCKNCAGREESYAQLLYDLLNEISSKLVMAKFGIGLPNRRNFFEFTTRKTIFLISHGKNSKLQISRSLVQIRVCLPSRFDGSSIKHLLSWMRISLPSLLPHKQMFLKSKVVGNAAI